MNVVDDLTGLTIIKVAKDIIDPTSSVSTDGFRSYNALGKEGYRH